MWLKVLRQNITHFARRAKGSASVEQKNGNGNAKSNKTNNNGVEVNRNEEQNGTGDKGQAKKKPSAPGNGPLLQQREISNSQLDFFKMLDEKIDNGPDYDESLDDLTQTRAERVSSLLRQWELASVTELNNASPSTTKNRGSISIAPRQNMSAKDREGMRNIVGGRPESAPIYMRNANRVDGLQEIHHCPSPSMPRHVLESITQSPTQSLKNVTPPGSSSPTGFRYQDSYKECNANQPSAKTVKVHYTTTNSPMNGEYVTQQALYREQYLQQTGILPSQYSAGSPGGNVLRNNPYVQQYQIASPQHFSTPRKRGFNAAQMT
ncbi:target of wingless isoform X2 [Calliopsis andreniformis]|uniref:target of wingless isoform X2 n=1 Tax=Calliopsis andreniformis TaxID=337506 RepID=UPI003FCDDD0E